MPRYSIRLVMEWKLIIPIETNILMIFVISFVIWRNPCKSILCRSQQAKMNKKIYISLYIYISLIKRYIYICLFIIILYIYIYLISWSLLLLYIKLLTIAKKLRCLKQVIKRIYNSYETYLYTHTLISFCNFINFVKFVCVALHFCNHVQMLLNDTKFVTVGSN